MTDELRVRLSELHEADSIAVIVTFSDQLSRATFSGRRTSAEPMIRSLQSLSRTSEGVFRSLLEGEILQPAVRFFWINNSAALKATAGFIAKMAGSPAISTIDYDAPVAMADENPPTVTVLGGDPVWNISKVGVDSVWSTYGLDGAGIVVGSMDTGIDTSHPALSGKWRGGSNSWIDIVNGRSAPYDDNGHGTATVGVMVGGDGPGPLSPDIGVAPGARVISAKVLNSGNSFSLTSTVIAGAQWMLDPDGNPATNDFPHVINNSWYFFTQGFTGFYSTIEAWRAVGIIPVFCIGNSGPGAGTTRSPADYNNCIGVGGTNSSDGRYTNTSEGPSPNGSSFPTDRRKPDLSAPGQGVVTSSLGGSYGSRNGTSFAAPHVAGTVALMLQQKPSLEYDQILAILDTTTVDPGTAGYDDIFGYGRIDAVRAIGSLPAVILSTATAGGSISPAGSVEVVRGANQTFAISPIAGYSIDSVTVDGVKVDSTTSYTFINVTVSHTIRAAFRAGRYALTMSATNGTVMKSPDLPLYDSNATVRLTALPSVGYTFSGWSGDATGSMNPLDLVMDGDKSVTAGFTGISGGTAVSVNRGWNIVSLPVDAADTNRADVFPTSTTPLYSYDAGYTSGETMEIGRGYWLKFPADDVVFIGADSVSEATATVAEGWNMVGSISVPIPVSSIGSDPPGLVTGPFYGYGHGYVTSETLEPGKGYWVKVSGPGTLTLSASPAAAGTKTIIITPDSESPPPPPGEVNALAGADLPGEFVIRQNYPNPFNPVTRIEYDLPVKSVVSLSIYNTLGQEVAMLVNGEQEAGVKTIDFDASSLPTGVYVCKFSTGRNVLTTRMMLLK